MYQTWCDPLNVIAKHNDQDHRAGGPMRVIVEMPKTSNEANDEEKPKM